jgi:hypothetical protein
MPVWESELFYVTDQNCRAQLQRLREEKKKAPLHCTLRPRCRCVACLEKEENDLIDWVVECAAQSEDE